MQVTKIPVADATTPADTFLSAGQGTEGNEFVFDSARWVFNLQTKNFTGTGAYTITVLAGGDDVIVGSPTGTFVVQ
ncbi:MAG: hypothetical protein JJE04_24295 [Acidobacteriia bacterium]|nr:hypothetical protein [Terriglobia bacterium]